MVKVAISVTVALLLYVIGMMKTTLAIITDSDVSAPITFTYSFQDFGDNESPEEKAFREKFSKGMSEAKTNFQNYNVSEYITDNVLRYYTCTSWSF